MSRRKMEEVHTLKKGWRLNVEDFQELRLENPCFVDKSLLIRDLTDLQNKVTLFLRPRKFGKTINMSMLKYFYSLPLDGDKRYLFEDLAIWKAGEKYMSQQGQYPVISITFKDVDGYSFENVFERLKYNIQLAYEDHKYLFGSTSLSQVQKQYFYKIWEGTADRDAYERSLLELSCLLEQHHKRKVILLIDAYDTPLQKSKTHEYKEYYEQILGFLQPLLHKALRGNDSLQQGILAGYLMALQTDIFGECKQQEIQSILRPDCAEHFGFTQDEVDKILAFLELEDKGKRVQEFYKGYRFGEKNIYCPWSISNYVSGCLLKDNGFEDDDDDPDYSDTPLPYWFSLYGDIIINQIVETGNFPAHQEMEKLMAGQTIEYSLQENLPYDEIPHSLTNLWSALLFIGYLTVVDTVQDGSTTRYRLQIPNPDVRYAYKPTLSTLLKKQARFADFSTLQRALIRGDTESAEVEICAFLMDTIRFQDQEEDYYYDVIVAFLSSFKSYTLLPYRAGGLQDNDFMVVSQQDNCAILLTFTSSKSTKVVDLEQDAWNALTQLEQIKKEDYAHNLPDASDAKVLRYGIGFAEKSCRIVREDSVGVLQEK